MDKSTQTAIIIAVSIFLVASIVSVFLLNRIQTKKRVAKKSYGRKKNNASDTMWLKVYMKLDSFPMTGDTVRKVTKKIQATSVYNPRDAYISAAKGFCKALGLAILFIILAIFMFDDIVSTMLCVVFGLAFSSVSVDKRVDALNLKVFNQLRGAISSIREEYLRTNSVAEAIENAEYGKELKTIFDQIHNILTTSNAELKLKEFFERVPFRNIQTLARVCYDINNQGDERDDRGNSNFMNALNNMSTDVNNEISRMNYQRMKFKGLEYLTLIPVVGIKVIEAFFVGIMPGTAVIYSGSAGYIIRIGILAIAIVIYTVIAKINTTATIKEDDRNIFFYSLIKYNFFVRRFIFDIAPKNDKKGSRNKWTNKLNKALSKKSVEEIYLEKVVYSISVFLISVLAIICAVQMGKQHMLNSVQTLSLVDMEAGVKIPDEDKLAMDNEFMEMFLLPKEHKLAEETWDISDDKFFYFVQGHCPGLSEMEIQDECKRVYNKAKTIANSYFHWYYLLICFGLASGAWFLPDALLKLRKWIVDVEAEEDFLQLQTLMGIMMNTDGDTLDALEQMSQISKIHKEMLLYCYHSYPANPDKELYRLENKTPIMEFRRFVGKMRLTTADLSLREVFCDLELERDFIQEQRNLKMRQAIDKKRTLCGKLSKIPMWLMVFGEFLYPVGYLGVTELLSAIGSMKSM